MGRAAVAITLSASERGELDGLARRRKTAQGLARRARIVLAAADGLENKAIVEQVFADANTVGKWRRRFAEHRLDGLYDEPRSGAPRTIDDQRIAEIIGRTLDETPPDGTHWSLCQRRRNNAPQEAPGRSGRGGPKLRHSYPLVDLGTGRGMYGVELYAAVRLAVVEEELSHHEAPRRFGIDRRTVKKMLSYSASPGYRRRKPVRRRKLDEFTGIIDAILEADQAPDVPAKQRHTAHRIFERLRYEYGFTAATRFRPCENSGRGGDETLGHHDLRHSCASLPYSLAA